jgi:hypothetical protein
VAAVALEDVKVLKETDKALLVDLEGEPVWVPKSCVDDDSEVYRLGDEGTLLVSEWWAIREGLC